MTQGTGEGDNEEPEGEGAVSVLQAVPHKTRDCHEGLCIPGEIMSLRLCCRVVSDQSAFIIECMNVCCYRKYTVLLFLSFLLHVIHSTVDCSALVSYLGVRLLYLDCLSFPFPAVHRYFPRCSNCGRPLHPVRCLRRWVSSWPPELKRLSESWWRRVGLHSPPFSAVYAIAVWHCA